METFKIKVDTRYDSGVSTTEWHTLTRPMGTRKLVFVEGWVRQNIGMDYHSFGTDLPHKGIVHLPFIKDGADHAVFVSYAA